MGNNQLKSIHQMYQEWKSTPKSIYGVLYQLFRSIIDNWVFLKKLGVKKGIFVTSVILFFIMYLFQSIGIGLLLPIANGILNHNFNQQFTTGFLYKIGKFFPFILKLDDLTIFIILISFVFISTVIKVLISYYSNLYLLRKKLKISTKASKFVFEKYLSFGKKFFDETTAGKETAIVTQVPTTVTACIEALLNTLNITIEIGMTYILMLFISLKFALISLIFIPLFIVVTKKLNEQMKDILESEKDPEGVTEFNSTYNYFLRIPLMKAYNAEKYEQKLFNDTCEEGELRRIKVEQVMSMHGPMTEIVTLVLLLVFVSILAISSFSAGKGEVATYLVIFLLFQNIMKSTRNLTSKSLQITRVMMNLRKIMVDIENIEKYRVMSGPKILRGLEKSISFKYLIFGYNAKRNVLRGVTFEIPMGKFTAIVGKTGSGKSTLISLLLRFYECTPGRIFIDGTDIREYNIESVRRNISYISQDTIIFNDTIYNNLIYGYPGEVDKKKFEAVVAKAQLNEMISELPNGFNSQIGDRGTTLSGGEKQRIAIARALLRDSEIIIMDEPTSSLDSSTEEKVKEALKEVFENKTVIVIAHRLSTIMSADNIVVINDGKVEQQGQFKDLIDKAGPFKNMYDSQKIK